MRTPLCLFDLDGTLAEGRTIERLAERFGVDGRLDGAFDRGRDAPTGGIDESARIMRLFADVEEEDFDACCRDLVLRPGAEEAVEGLEQMGFTIGVVTATYLPAANEVRQRLGLDLAVAAEPVVEKGRLTGALAPSEFRGPCGTHICKAAVLETHAGDGFTVAIGDGANDICMLQAADLGIAVAPCPLEVRLAADVVVTDLRAIPAVVQKAMMRPAALARR